MSSTGVTEQQIAATQKKLDARKRFESVFPLLVDELVSHLRSTGISENAIEWYRKVVSWRRN